MSVFHDERDFADGDLVVAEGDSGTDMFIIQYGSVAVTKKVGDQHVHLATLERGDFFGEMSLLESLPRSATVRAVGQTRLVAVRAGELLMKIRRDPTFAFEMLQHMSRRIRELDERMVTLLERSGSSAIEARIVVTELEFEATPVSTVSSPAS
jgi:CRP/FNR family cyclic AMP-dependent transcriptional regulator